MSAWRKLTVAFAAACSITGVGMAGTGLYQTFGPMKDDYTQAAGCVNKIKENQQCSLEEQKSVLKVQKNDKQISDGVFLTVLGGFTL
jgi:hypothetical protein